MAATDNAMNADATEVEAHVTRTTEARTIPTLVQAAATAARRLDNIMAAEPTTNEAATDNALNVDATDVEADVTTIADALTALTLPKAAVPVASPIDNIMAAMGPTNNTLNADATEVEADVTRSAEKPCAPTRVQQQQQQLVVSTS